MRSVRDTAGYGAVLLMGALVLAGCGKASYDAKENTVFVLEKGRVVSTDVGDLPEDQYNREEFEAYVKDAIRSYNEEYGEDCVRLTALSVEDDVAKLTIEYASSEDFSRFSGIELFSGSVSDALAAGYDFNVAFVDAESGKSCELADILDDGSLQVAVVRGNVALQVEDDIVYYSSENVKLTDERSVSIRPSENKASSVEPAAEEASTEGALAVSGAGEGDAEEAVRVLDGDSAELAENDDGSVDDDELLVGTEEAQMTFQFDRDAASSGENSGGTSDVYTYIVYK